MPAMGYDQDFFLWTRQQAEALRAAARSGANLPIDWQNIAEEIESLGRSDRRELASRIGTILEHLMKLQSSPASDPRGGWEATVLRERDAIMLLLRDSPSLRRRVTDTIRQRLPAARRVVERELAPRGEQVAARFDYTKDQGTGDWLP